MPLLRGETASFQGEQYQVNGLTLDIPGGTDLPVVLAALGPAMIKLTAEMADGTNTWMVGPKTHGRAHYSQLPGGREKRS